jgi:hypothetical protein
MKRKFLLFVAIAAAHTAVYSQSGNVGIGTATPGTKLDVNGAITMRETLVPVSGNAATIPANASQIQLTGSATAAIIIAAPAAPNAGQRLAIFNNTSGGQGALLNGFPIYVGQTLEFAYSNGNWRATNGGAINGDFDWMKAGNNFPNGAGDTAQNIYHAGGHVGIGTNAPVGKLHIYNSPTGNEAGNDIIIDDESAAGQIPGMVLRRSNAGADLAANDLIGAIVFNPKTNGAFGYSGSGIRSLYRGNGTNMLNNLVFNINNNQEAMRIDENGNAGIGTVVPGSRLAVNGGAAIGSTYAGTAAPANGAIIEGNVGIANTAPTRTLDVNGTARIRSAPALPGTTIASPLYVDALGNVSRLSPAGEADRLSGYTGSVASGATVAAISSGIPDGTVWKCAVSNWNQCGNIVVVEFWITTSSINAMNSCKGRDGTIASSGTSAPVFNETQSTTAVTWTGVPVCAPANSTEFNFTIAVGSTTPHVISITNNSNVADAYTVTMEKIALQ